MGEAVTYKGDEEAVALLKGAARKVPGVPSVVDMNAKIGSEDCTMLIRRVQEHGGKAAFCYYGCNHHGHHRPDFSIQDETSLGNLRALHRRTQLAGLRPTSLLRGLPLIICLQRESLHY